MSLGLNSTSFIPGPNQVLGTTTTLLIEDDNQAAHQLKVELDITKWSQRDSSHRASCLS